MSKYNLCYKIEFKFDVRTLMLRDSNTGEMLPYPKDLIEAFRGMALECAKDYTDDKGTYSYGMPYELVLLNKCGCTTYGSMHNHDSEAVIAFSLVLTYDQDEVGCEGYIGVNDLAQSILSEFESWYIDKRFFILSGTASIMLT